MFKHAKISAILFIAIVLIGIVAATSLTTAASSTTQYPYGGNMPPWVDQHSTINAIPTVIVNATLWSSPQKDPYNGNLPPWVEYNVTPSSPIEPIVLTITGNVNNPISFTMSQLRSYPITHTTVYYKNDAGTTKSLEADMISLNALLDKAGPKSSATSVIFEDTNVPPTINSNPVQLSSIRSAPDAWIAFTTSVGLRDYVTGISAHDMAKYLNVIVVQ